MSDDDDEAGLWPVIPSEIVGETLADLAVSSELFSRTTKEPGVRP